MRLPKRGWCIEHVLDNHGQEDEQSIYQTEAYDMRDALGDLYFEAEAGEWGVIMEQRLPNQILSGTDFTVTDDGVPDMHNSDLYRTTDPLDPMRRDTHASGAHWRGIKWTFMWEPI